MQNQYKKPRRVFVTGAGHGIGLAVSRQIIRLHGGSLRLKHNEEGRVTFAVVME